MRAIAFGRRLTRSGRSLFIALTGASIALLPFLPVDRAMAGSTYAAAVLADNPSIYWRLDNTAGTTAVDSSPNQANGTEAANIVLLRTGATSDGDLAIQTVGNGPAVTYGQAGNAPALPQGNNPWSVEFWMKGGSTYTTLWSMGCNSTAGSGVTFTQKGVNSFSLTIAGSSTSPVFTSKQSVSNGSWNDLAVTYNGQTVSVYVNGTLAGSNTLKTALNLIPCTLSLGGSTTSSASTKASTSTAGRSFDEFALYPQALSTTRLLAHYNAARAVSPQLPDLGMDLPYDIHIVTSTTGQRLLEFDSLIVNVGGGSFEVTGTRANTNSGTGVGATMTSVTQRVYYSNGTHVDYPTTATMYYAGDGHQHWHIQGLESYSLTDSNGVQVAMGSKEGFCPEDDDVLRMPLSPSHPVGTSCGDFDPSALAVTDHISTGWADIYTWNTVGQYIDITNLPTGTYTLTLTADPLNQFMESNENNNSSSIDLYIPANSTSFTVVDQNPGAYVGAPCLWTSFAGGNKCVPSNYQGS